MFHGHSVRFDTKAVTSPPASIDAAAKAKPVREMARMVADKGGFTLENADALSERQVSFKFDKVSPVSALKMLADIDGKRAVFNGHEVRFDPK